jgi:hypothetical protein
MRRREGSRFAGWQFYKVAAGGSRKGSRIVHTMYALRIFGPRRTVSQKTSWANGNAMGYSREPPAATLQSCTLTKRLPSRRFSGSPPGRVSWILTPHASRFSEHNPGFAHIIGRDFNFDFVAGNNTNEVLPHLSANMGEDPLPVW